MEGFSTAILQVPSWRAGQAVEGFSTAILQVPSWRAGQAVEGFSTAHIAGSKLASRPSCGRF